MRVGEVKMKMKKEEEEVEKIYKQIYRQGKRLLCIYYAYKPK